MSYILLTGASGFVGYHLSRALAREAQSIAGTYLTTNHLPTGVLPVPIDLTDAAAVSRLIRDMKPSAVVHCAAQTNTATCEREPEEAHAAIVLATNHLCSAIARHAPSTPLVTFSTDLVFSGEEAPYAEPDATAPLNRYGRLKVEAEAATLTLERGMVLRSALIYGPPTPTRSSFLSWMAATLAREEPLTLFADEWRTPIYVDDLHAAVKILLRVGSPGIYHAGGPDWLSRVEMGLQMAQVFGLSQQPISPRTRSDAGQSHLRAKDVSLQCSRLLALGWQQTPFLHGLKESLHQWQPTAPS